jgi:hypothetical protein
MSKAIDSVMERLSLRCMHLFTFKTSLLFFLKLGADALERGEFVELFRLFLFSLHGLAHNFGDAGFVKDLVREDRHFDLVSNAN